MRRVLSGCCDAIMTGLAASQYLGVIDGHHRCPQVRRVAVLADVGRLNVSGILTGRVGAIVAAYTVAGDAHVVEVRRQPGDGAVAIVAGITARDVSRVFPRRGDAIMTGSAASQYLGVIDGQDRRPQVRRMTIFADVCGLYVRRSLPGCVCAVMAAYAVAGNVHMVEICR